MYQSLRAIKSYALINALSARLKLHVGNRFGDLIQAQLLLIGTLQKL